MILYLYWCNIISIHILVIIHENQYTIVKEVMIYDTLVKSSQLRFFCVYIYNVIFIHTYVQLRIYLSIPSHPIPSFSERYPVTDLWCQSCNTNQVPRPSRFKLFSVFADTFVQSALGFLAGACWRKGNQRLDLDIWISQQV